VDAGFDAERFALAWLFIFLVRAFTRNEGQAAAVDVDVENRGNPWLSPWWWDVAFEWKSKK
jgi:hypothetical protein